MGASVASLLQTKPRLFDQRGYLHFVGSGAYIEGDFLTGNGDVTMSVTFNVATTTSDNTSGGVTLVQIGTVAESRLIWDSTNRRLFVNLFGDIPSDTIHIGSLYEHVNGGWVTVTSTYEESTGNVITTIASEGQPDLTSVVPLSFVVSPGDYTNDFLYISSYVNAAGDPVDINRVELIFDGATQVLFNGDTNTQTSFPLTFEVGGAFEADLGGGGTLDVVLSSDPRGQEIGIGDWRLFVERLNGYVDGTEEPFVVGAFKVGASADGGDDPKVGSFNWEDLTDRWRGSSILRGADEPFGRARVGEMVMTLDNRDGFLSPTVDYADTRPGVIMRISLASPTDTRANGWLPIFTGLVDSWVVRQSGPRQQEHTYADEFVEVILVETLSAIARIDDNATTTQGAGETFTPRIKRLLNAARWRYGFVSKISSAVENITLQSTDMAKPRLEEAYLTADSTLRAVRSDVTGAACLTDPNLLGVYRYSRLGDFSWSGTLSSNYADAGKPRPWLRLQPHSENLDLEQKRLVYDAESLIVANDPEHLINDVRYARAGGTQQVAENKVSIGRFGRATLSRGDLLNNNDAHVLYVARARCNQTARTTFRIDELHVTATGKDDLYTLILAALDLGDFCTISPRADDLNVRAEARVRTIIHEITPLRPGALAWTATLSFDVSSLFNFPPGSFLPGFDL